MSEIQNTTGTLTTYYSPYFGIIEMHQFVNLERNDKSLHLTNDCE